MENLNNAIVDNTFAKTIGKATYNVHVHFSKSSKENFK